MALRSLFWSEIGLAPTHRAWPLVCWVTGRAVTDERPRVVVARCTFPSLQTEQRILGAVGAEVVDGRFASDDELCNRCRRADAVMTDYFSIDRALIQRMERCRIICVYRVGFDNIDVGAATENGIFVSNTPDYCTEEVADHALALLLCLWRKIIPLNDSVQAGE